MLNASQIGSVLYLCILSIIDIKTRKLPIWLLAAGSTGSIIVRAYQADIPLTLVFAGGITGVVFIGISKMTREAIGYGDSLCIMNIGIYLGIWKLIGVLLLSFLLSALFAAMLLVYKRFNRKVGYPFIPFLLIAYFFFLITGEG